MIYIIIDHINGEIDTILDKYTTSKIKAKKFYMLGYIVIQIDLINNIVKEYEDD